MCVWERKSINDKGEKSTDTESEVCPLCVGKQVRIQVVEEINSYWNPWNIVKIIV